MRKLFSEFGLSMLSAICCIYTINIFIDALFKSNTSFVNILKLWLTRLM